MKSMNSEIKKVVNRVKEAQSQFQTLIKTQDWIDEARKYAERQGKELRKLFAPDVEKMKSFLERERKELERFQKQIPGEVKKIRKFVALQKKEFEKLLVNIRKMAPQKTGVARASNGKSTRSKPKTAKRAAPKKKSASMTSPSTVQESATSV